MLHLANCTTIAMKSTGTRHRRLMFTVVIAGFMLTLVNIANAMQQSQGAPILYYSTEVVPADECDVLPIDPAVVREAAARVYARPLKEAPETSTVEPPAYGVHVVATERQLRSSSISVYVDGQPFIEEGEPVPDGVPASPYETTDRATLESIHEFLRLRAACDNTGDPTRSIALFSPTGIEAAIEDVRADGVEQAFFDDITTLDAPLPSSDEQVLAPIVGDVRIARDGSAVVYGLFVLTTKSTQPGVQQEPLNVVVLVPVEGRWRIEQSLPRIRPVSIAPEDERPATSPVSDSGTPAAGTPAAGTPATVAARTRQVR